jgi:2-methylisocitrate lyase-like PEP mutase family enzyme
VGKTDGAVGRDEMITHVGDMAAGTDLPVSADLENCYADEPEAAAETIRLAAAAGVVGGSIEDATGRPEQPIYEFAQAVDRVRAASAVARSLPFTFTLTARAENYLHGRPDLKDTIKRLRHFREQALTFSMLRGCAAKKTLPLF